MGEAFRVDIRRNVREKDSAAFSTGQDETNRGQLVLIRLEEVNERKNMI